MKEAIIGKFMSDSPFQLHRFPEALQVQSRAEGRAWYHLLAASAEDKTVKKATIPYGATIYATNIEVEIMSTIPAPTCLNHTAKVVEDGKMIIWQESRNPVGDRSRIRAGSTYQQDSIIEKGDHLNMGGFYVESEVTNVSKLAMVLNRELSKSASELQKNPESRTYKEYSSRLASFAYGFAEEARKAGDEKTADFAELAAAKIMPKDKFDDMIKRRVSESGTFKLTRDELLGN